MPRSQRLSPYPADEGPPVERPEKEDPDAKYTRTALAAFKKAKEGNFRGDNVLYREKDADGTARTILLLTLPEGGKQRVLIRSATVESPAYRAYMEGQPGRLEAHASLFREAVGPRPDPLTSFRKAADYLRLRSGYLEAQYQRDMAAAPERYMEKPVRLGHFAEGLAVEGILRHDEARKEGGDNVAQFLVDDIFPHVPLVKTANMILIIQEKQLRGIHVGAWSYLEVGLSFVDDVMTVAPGIGWGAGALGKVGRVGVWVTRLQKTKGGGLLIRLNEGSRLGRLLDVAKTASSSELVVGVSDLATPTRSGQNVARFARRVGSKEPPPHPLLQRWITEYHEEYARTMIPEDISALVRQIEAYRGPQGQKYVVKTAALGPLDASSEGRLINLPTQTRQWIALEEWYHSRGKLEGFLKDEIEAIKKSLPVAKKPPGYKGQFPKKIYREDAAKEIAVKEHILKNHGDLLTQADRTFIENQLAVLREWGVLYGY